MSLTAQITSDTVVILDAGAQYGKVIDRRVRELGIHSIILPLSTPASQLTGCAAVIISGGPQSVYSADAPEYDPSLFELSQPILGICYGMQLMVHASGGKVEKKDKREDGQCDIMVDNHSALFENMSQTQQVLMSHGDTVTTLPDGYTVCADSSGLIAAIQNESKKRYAVQFHPEVDLTVNGHSILKNFLVSISKVPQEYTVRDREEIAIEEIKNTVGDSRVLVLVSGGVDSTVCAALLRRALREEQIMALHVDSGMMRRDESKQVQQALKSLGVNLTVVDASNTFQSATTQIQGASIGPLCEMTEPQEKRKIIGDTFVRVAREYLASLQLDLETVFLAQGTLRTDLIESASSLVSSSASTIKTHHNDTDVVRALRDAGRVIEPLKEYHKDEVRALGEQLGLPKDMVWRQPFPGPGLGIRILCAREAYLTPDYSDILEKLRAHVPAKYAVTLLPVRSVGVQGDGRTYSYAAALSCDSSHESFSVDDWQELMQLARELPKFVHQINRVVYLFGPTVATPVTQITPTLLVPETISQLQYANAAVDQVLLDHQLTESLSQVPVVLVPLDFESAPDAEMTKRSVVIRTFITNDFMTGVPAVPGVDLSLDALSQMVSAVTQQTPNLSRVMYDLTAKPPGTTEWE